MSGDEEVQTEVKGKRGRKPAADKRPKKDEKKEVDGDAPPVKRGRGRPKGSGKKKEESKAKNGKAEGTGRGRGRKKKEEKKEESASEEENGDSAGDTDE